MDVGQWTVDEGGTGTRTWTWADARSNTICSHLCCITIVLSKPVRCDYDLLALWHHNGSRAQSRLLLDWCRWIEPMPLLHPPWCREVECVECGAPTKIYELMSDRPHEHCKSCTHRKFTAWITDQLAPGPYPAKKRRRTSGTSATATITPAAG